MPITRPAAAFTYGLSTGATCAAVGEGALTLALVGVLGPERSPVVAYTGLALSLLGPAAVMYTTNYWQRANALPHHVPAQKFMRRGESVGVALATAAVIAFNALVLAPGLKRSSDLSAPSASSRLQVR